MNTTPQIQDGQIQSMLSDTVNTTMDKDIVLQEDAYGPSLEVLIREFGDTSDPSGNNGGKKNWLD